MENQHRKIKGYLELSQEEIGIINEIKEGVRELCEKLHQVNINEDFEINTAGAVTKRGWIVIAETHLQQGFMALKKVV